MKITYLGGAEEVGASSILVELMEKKVLLDSGIRQKKTKDKLPDFNLTKELGGIDAIIISHAHMDHIGSLPLISKEYPEAKIYMNKMTRELAHVLLYDSLKIMKYHDEEIPIFSEDDVVNMFQRVEIVPYQKETKIFDDVYMTFYQAGHIAGACVTVLKTKSGTALYTGDYSLFNQHAISGLSIPKLRPDLVISEATYGNRLHANRELEERRLIDTVSGILADGGKVLIPVFALGRSQEILLILKKAFNKKQLPECEVYVDGMVRNINSVFQNNPLYLRENLGKRILKGIDIFYDNNIKKIDTDEDRKKIVESSKPSIIVASSGMLMGGMSEFYASHLVETEKNGLILTGYQDEESNGSILLGLLDTPIEERKIKLNGKICNVKCLIEKVGLSAHADKQEMKNLFATLSPKYIILGHGDAEAISELASEVTREIKANVFVPRVGDTLNIDIRNPRKQIDHSLKYIYGKGDSLENLYAFINVNYRDKLFTREDLAYIYYGRDSKEDEAEIFTEELLKSPYFTHDARRYFLFKITDELELMKNKDKEMTPQEIEAIIKDMFSSFPYTKISFYMSEKRVVLTFDFPRTIDSSFDSVAKEVLDMTNIQVEKNENINNLACENKIREIIGDAVNKISYLPNEDRFKIKVYEIEACWQGKIKKEIGYDVELVKVSKVVGPILKPKPNGMKMEQNEAMIFIDNFFASKDHKPYKKSLKNGNIVLSFITYQIGLKYEEDIKELGSEIGWQMELNRSTNINLVFTILDKSLNDHGLIKKKNPSFKAEENKVTVILEEHPDEACKKVTKYFEEETGLNLEIV